MTFIRTNNIRGPIGPRGPEGPQGQAGSGITPKGTTNEPPTGVLRPPGSVGAGTAAAIGDAVVVQGSVNPANDFHMWVYTVSSPPTWSDMGELQGPAGPPGPTGPAGTYLLTGPVNPPAFPATINGITPRNGDNYLNTVNGEVWKVFSSSWIKQAGSLQGPQGLPGDDVVVSTTDPGTGFDLWYDPDATPTALVIDGLLPMGGLAGQILTKSSSTQNFASTWQDPPSSGTGGTGGVPSTRTISAGDGLVGGGALSADRTLHVGAGTGITVNPDSVGLTDMPAARIKGAVTAGPPADLTGTQVTAQLDVFDATHKGLVPAPPTTPNGKVLSDNGTWITPSSGGGGSVEEVAIGTSDPGPSYELWYDPTDTGGGAFARTVPEGGEEGQVLAVAPSDVPEDLVWVDTPEAMADALYQRSLKIDHEDPVEFTNLLAGHVDMAGRLDAIDAAGTVRGLYTRGLLDSADPENLSTLLAGNPDLAGRLEVIEATAEVPGPVGPEGPVGPAGADGADSTVPGPVGPAGPPGADGVDGVDGADGADGVDGADSTVPGPPGETGSVGPVGATGATGPEGQIGPAGPAGVDGVGIYVKGAVVDAADLPTAEAAGPGDAYVTEDTGHLWLSDGESTWTDAGQFRGSSGPIGPEGPVGPTGPTGAIGPAGAASTVPGPQGLKGDPGADSTVPGPQGVKGDTGATGAASTVPGPQGIKGDKGDTGSTGPAGAASTVPGPTGPQGIQGPVGPAPDTSVFQLRSEKAAASGYASLDASAKVPFTQLPSGTTATTVAIGNHTHAIYQLLAEKAVANGYASLGADGKVPIAQLPVITTQSSSWVWINSPITAPQGNGKTGVNTDVPSQATQFWINKLDQQNGADYSYWITQLKNGDHLYLQIKADATTWQRWTVTGAPVQNTTNWVIPIITAGGSTTAAEPANNAAVLIAFQIGC